VKFLVKAPLPDISAQVFDLPRQKTMYGGRRISVGDRIYLFDSENEGGQGLVARGIVIAASAVARKRGVERQTPLVNIEARRTTMAKRRLGREELKPFSNWKDGRPETELNFKFYRQATNKLGGISDEAATFLDGYFKAPTKKPGRPRARRPAAARSR
jgi:hypothetical protein